MIRDPKFLPPSLRIKTNQLNALHGDEPTDPPRGWNRQSPSSNLKIRTSTHRTSPVVSAIMGILNHHAIDNGDVEFHHSEFLFESNYESAPCPYTTKIK